MTHDLDNTTLSRLRLLFAASSLLAASALTTWLRPDQPTVPSLLALAGVLIVALPIVLGVIKAIRATGFAATQFYMDQYVVLALAACLATGRYLTGGIVAVILVFGQMMEERTTVGVELALSKLRQLNRLIARRRRGELEEEVEAAELHLGDIIVLRPGEVVPADAVILTGSAMMDQSRITGESAPVEASTGNDIFAGTLNLNGALTARVTGAGTDTVMGRVQSIIEEAKSSEAPIISMAEDYARYYTPLIMLIAVSVFFFTQDVERAIAVLVVSIPCAFVLASPSAMVSAIAAGSRMGLLIKSVRHLESARLVDTVVFDKTGTLTVGRLELEDVLLHDGAIRKDEALRLAAALESSSNHPVARAIAQAGESLTLPEVTDLIEHPGLGLEGMVEGQKIQIGRLSWLKGHGMEIALDPTLLTRHSLVLLSINGRHTATFLLADRIRDEAAETLTRLRSLGITDFVMLTGDRAEVAQHIASSIGITDFQAECLPEDKVARIRLLKQQGHRVLVVGDGLNDAPALKEGDLGVAMGALGNDITVHTSDVALMSGDLRRLADLLVLSARTVGIINQNLLCGFLFIIAAVTASSLGLVNPVLAAFLHEFSAFFVIFNSARLLRFDGMEVVNASPENATVDRIVTLPTAVQ
jgi:Cd2+/Zn2+-exporting ATPase